MKKIQELVDQSLDRAIDKVLDDREVVIRLRSTKPVADVEARELYSTNNVQIEMKGDKKMEQKKKKDSTAVEVIKLIGGIFCGAGAGMVVGTLAMAGVKPTKSTIRLISKLAGVAMLSSAAWDIADKQFCDTVDSVLTISDQMKRIGDNSDEDVVDGEITKEETIDG